MKNGLLITLIIVAAIFPFATTAVELARDMMAAAALAGMTLVAILVAVAAMLYRAKPAAGSDTPVQAIPSMPGAKRAAAGSKRH